MTHILNPEQVWRYVELSEDGEVMIEMSEKEILDTWFEVWSEHMRERGKEDLISQPNCIEDCIVVNWAWAKDD